MENWARIYRFILENSGILVSVLAGYVDDGRQVTSVLRPGMRFREEVKKFEFCQEGEIEDLKKITEGET